VIEYIMVADGLTFPQALVALGIKTDNGRQPQRKSSHQKAAALLAQWLNQQHLLVGAKCREVSSQIALADAIPNRELSASRRTEWSILSDLQEDLANPAFAAELWEARDSIEAITGDVEPEAVLRFPPLTESYRAQIRSIVQC
jgi:hypothetical protein